MRRRENLFYGLGMVVYSIASADGKIQAAEKNELKEMLAIWMEDFEVEFEISEIIFSILEKTKPNYKEGYALGIKYIENNKELLTAKLVEKFIYLVKDIARAFPPVTIEEKQVIELFESDLRAMN